MQRKKAPAFEPGISRHNIRRAMDRIRVLGYTGPVSVGTDDTSIEKALQAYLAADGSWLVVGGCAGPIVARPPQVPGVPLEQGAEDSDLDILDILRNKDTICADKLRVVILTIPVPKVSTRFSISGPCSELDMSFQVPPIVLAAIPRGGLGDSAEQLLYLHNQIIELLSEYDCYPIGGAVDGTETERKVQRLIDHTHPTVRYKIAATHPRASFELITAIVNEHPFVNGQDSKHGAKTARNQALTGARSITLGRYSIQYSMLFQLAHESGSPLMVRDVERLDRQDDRAAARFLSSALLFHISKCHPDWVGLAVYIFITGGIFQAWQNRSISHKDRLKLVLRGRYFLQFWREHTICHPFHSLNINFISRESFDILTIICESYIKLLRIYRDQYPKNAFLPWFHSTEENEHLYGVMRTIKMDFTYLDFVQMVPKADPLLLGSFGESMAEAKSNATASGYQHTYFRYDNVNLKALTTWPSDEFINEAAVASALEATQLLEACGVYSPDASTVATAGPPSDSSIEVNLSDSGFLIRESSPTEVFKQSALLGMLRDLENNDVERFEQVVGSLSVEESDALQKMTFSQIGLNLGLGQEMYNNYLSLQSRCSLPHFSANSFQTLQVAHLMKCAALSIHFLS